MTHARKTTHTSTKQEKPAMTKPTKTTTATIAAAIAATHTDPAVFAVPTTKGVAGVLVLFGAPTEKPTPSTLRTRFSDAIDRAAPTANDVDATGAFLGGLPDVVTPVAALGLAVRDAVETDARWVHNRTAEKSSRWTYCASSVTADAVSIHGHGTCAEALADGTLTIDSGVPSHIATKLRDGYNAARGVVEPTRISALVAAFLTKQGGRSVASSAYLMPHMTAATCGVLAGLSDLGGWGLTYAVADPAQIQALATPVVRSIEEQIADVERATADFVARAAAAAKPDGGRFLAKSGETMREEIAAARAAASLWRDRLNLAALDVDGSLDALDKAADEADRVALAAVAKRRENAKLAREVAAINGAPDAATLKAIDDAADRDARRARSGKGGAK